MAQPSKAGSVILFLFGLPFFAFGAYASFAFFTSAPSVHGNTNPIAGAIFASVFAIIGAGLMYGAVAIYRQSRQDADHRVANPDSPWLWRDDWAQGRALSRKAKTIYTWWIGAILASMLFLPMAVINAPSLLRAGDPKVFFLLIPCLLSAGLLAGALRATIRRQRYGRTYFEFASLPFSPGTRLRGQIHLRLDTAAEHGIDLRLSSIRRIVTGSGRERQVSEVPLWQEERNVPQGSLMIGPTDTSIPVEFDIPEDVYETNHEVHDDQVLWTLHAQADVPGIDYADDFELPVFRSAAKAARAGAAAGDAEWRPAFHASSVPPRSASRDLPAPANPKVVVSINTQGATEFYFPPFRNPGRTFLLLVFTTVWTAVVYFLVHSKSPLAFAVVFGLVDLLLFYGCAKSLFGRARIVVGDGKLVSRRGTFGNPVRDTVLFSGIDSVQVVAAAQNTNSWSSSYMIRLHAKDGRTLKLIDDVADRTEACWVVAQIEKLTGLKPDTQVVVQSMGRDMGPPPQRD